MKGDDEIFESLIAGGVIGAALGSLISKNKDDGATLGAIAGAAIIATFKANEKAKQTNLPLYEEESGNLYKIEPGGNKQFIRKIEKSKVRLPENFKLN